MTGSNKGIGLAIVKGLCEQFKGTVILTGNNIYSRILKSECRMLLYLNANMVFYKDFKSCIIACLMYRQKDRHIDKDRVDFL